ncbi:hypothetical protein [Nocardia sp. NBC_01009]|uniref:hypothetical protein n=1 Tax=Nocardia sp. NBC_01009 TaxID=2975996 RepID=UPI0038685664|nr:hypothetical protein OHA42_23220 [Nocardia sp. NBC_01009]
MAVRYSCAAQIRTEQLAAATLGVPGADETWRRPLPPNRRTVAGAVAGEVRWAADHLLPWMLRRLHGRSSGTDIEPKRPTLLPVPS